MNFCSRICVSIMQTRPSTPANTSPFANSLKKLILSPSLSLDKSHQDLPSPNFIKPSYSSLFLCIHTPMEKKKTTHHVLALFTFILFNFTESQSFLGVNYGQVADNLPPPASTSKLLQSTSFSKVRLYNADPSIIQALSNTGISLVIATSNADITTLASSPSFASQWISTNFLPYTPKTKISTISVGNEVLNSGDASLYSQLLPAMQNLQNALPKGSGVKISTVHSMAVMAQSNPPSSGALHSDLMSFLGPILKFLSDNGGPFMINPYPYFAYRDDPRPETLAYCLFQPNQGRIDSNSKITYMNMFDAQVDAIKSALNVAGYGTVEIVVAETGWPYKGDDNEVGATIENAKAYNGNLVKHLNTKVGTPLMPGKSVDTYIFALYDEDLKPGPTSERSFGMYHTDLTMIYDAGLTKSISSQASPPPQIAATNSTPPTQPAQLQPHPPDCNRVRSGLGCNGPISANPPFKSSGFIFTPSVFLPGVGLNVSLLFSVFLLPFFVLLCY